MLTSDSKFLGKLNQLIQSIPYTNYVFESPRLVSKSIPWQPFEFVVIQVPPTDKQADPTSFRDQFLSSKEKFLVFPNMSHDSLLLVPNKTQLIGHNKEIFLNIANFLRSDEKNLISQFWCAIAKAVLCVL